MTQTGAEAGERAATDKRFPCKQCGAQLAYAPGTTTLVCRFCGAPNEIVAEGAPVEEEDFASQLARTESTHETVDRLLSRCEGCGADVQFPENVTATACPFCGKEVVATGRSVKVIKPRAVLPFAVKDAQARERYGAWLKGLWFAPRDLRNFAQIDGGLAGVYLPFWTFDSTVDTDYSGQRGDDYYTTETYTVNVGGRTQTRTRQVRHTRWRAAAGRVFNGFDDVLVCASRSLPAARVASLEPWDLKAIVPYADEYLAGFRSESYAIELRDGFEIAKGMMEPVIRQTICRDIAGDHQRIESVRSFYRSVTFKHVLLPVWTCAYRYRGKLYQILINARTGEISGERPWSAWKIALAVVVALAVIGVIVVIVVIASSGKQW